MTETGDQCNCRFFVNFTIVVNLNSLENSVLCYPSLGIPNILCCGDFRGLSITIAFSVTQRSVGLGVQG